jgi:hypothetical protein
MQSFTREHADNLHTNSVRPVTVIHGHRHQCHITIGLSRHWTSPNTRCVCVCLFTFLSVLICNQPNVRLAYDKTDNWRWAWQKLLQELQRRGTPYKSKQSNKHWPTFGCHTFNNNIGSIATLAVLINVWNTRLFYCEIKSRIKWNTAYCFCWWYRL